ncbi:hypothetical protein [Aliiglaciecola sp. NS0011-25]|uniref:hypothetical protein n=1 Tax=Aliiglaciecola sp. NS0011-25 TaxID=3127654 RepID=UPI003340DE58
MDALELLKQKNENHRKLLEKEKRFAIPLVINSFFVMFLLYYEFFSIISDDFDLAELGVLAFIWLFYQVSIFSFCSEFIKHYYAKCFILVVIHCGFLYMWIWREDRWGVSYIAGLLFLSVWFGAMYKATQRK